MTHKSQYAKAMTTLIALALFVTGCTKKRDASLPEDSQESIFAIAEFGELQTENTSLKVITDDEFKALSHGESAKATAEKGIVRISEANVPDRLKFMFKGLEMTGQAGHSYPISLSVDKEFVTTYKIVSNTSELSIVEKQLAQLKEEVVLQKQLQKAKDNKQIKSLMAKMKEVRAQKIAALSKKDSTLLVPLFKFKVEGYGVLQRAKNELKEETSTLRMKATDWNEASHIKISTKAADRLLVGISPASKGELDRTFVMDRINNKLTTAETLKKEFQIQVGLDDKARVLTLLDVKALHVFEIGKKSELGLSDSQLLQLQSGSDKTNVRACSAEIVKALPDSEKVDCVMVLRYDVPVSYVRPELPVVDEEGNQSATLNFTPVRAVENIGLVQIAANVEPVKIEADDKMDPRRTIRVSDIKGKEFFYKRTLQDAPVTSIFAPGLAGNLTIVKFEMHENRLVVRKSDKLIDFKSGSNETDLEELMSIPVKYLKTETKDAAGAKYAIPKLVPATRVDAEYIDIELAHNSLHSDFSPYESVASMCFRSIGDKTVADVDMKLDNGILNYTIEYSAGLSANCITDYAVVNDYNGTAPYQTNVKLKERVSFKLVNADSNSSYAPQVPFRVQNALGYGVWTIGKIAPTAQGLYGREGQEENFPVIHDFRNGKKLVYTVTGLEANVDLDPEIRQLYRDTTTEVVNSWDLAYRQAFKGTSLERTGRYVEVQFSGDAGVSAIVGDLDKNIIHYENKFNDNHGILGVSQVGYNPRSGVVVADALVVYAGNLQQFVASSQRNLQRTQQWDDMKKNYRAQALAQLAKQKDIEAEAKQQLGKEAKPSATPEQKAQAAAQFTKQLVQLANGKRLQTNSLVDLKKIKLQKSDLVHAASQMKKLGAEKFEYSMPKFEGAWLERVFRALYENSSMDQVELQGIVAKEMLAAKGAKLSAGQRAQLTRAARLGGIRTQMKTQFKNTPGCMMTERESVARDFAGMSFKDALREELFFDLGHEMGHSQGLTHNFIASFDKVNFNNPDGTPSKRNYSSIMDYIAPGKFRWDGIGAYDIHALRASHLGLIEGNEKLKDKLNELGLVEKVNRPETFISVQKIKTVLAKDGWNNFSRHQIAGGLRPYKYCTDIHVGYEPTCQRFDAGTTAEEVVENMIKDYEDSYVTNYHAWDRNDFGVAMASRVVGRSIMTMFQMRQFMDEAFYKMVMNNQDPELGDYVQAAVKSYLFYNQVINTPDAKTQFLSGDRFLAVPYQYKEKNEKGEETGKTITDIEIVEAKSLMTRGMNDERVDTVGVEEDKIMAMNFLTMKGFPAYKYRSQSLMFSFLDFEKYVLGMKPENSIVVNTFANLILDEAQPTFTNANAVLFPIEGQKNEVSPTMAAYAGIFGILNLEAKTLQDKDNFATLFKVGSSIGAAPTDRVALSLLGVSEQSKTRLTFWALDNAIAANGILRVASVKNFFIQQSPVLEPLMGQLAINQFQNLMSQGKNAEKVESAKAQLIAKLNELNANGMIAHPEMVKANPQLSVESQVANIMGFNEQVISVTIEVLLKSEGAVNVALELKNQADNLAKAVPIFAVAQKSLKGSMDQVAKVYGQQKGFEVLANLGEVMGQIVDGSQLDSSYGMIMKNIEFLSNLTLVTNPEYNR